MFINITALIANSVTNIKGEVRATCFDGVLHNNLILLLGQMLLQIHMISAAAIKILCELVAVQDKFIYEIDTIIFGTEKVAVITLARREQPVCLVPFSIFNPKVFSRHKFGVKHQFICTSCFIRFKNRSEYLFAILKILFIGRNVYAKKLCALNESIDAYGYAENPTTITLADANEYYLTNVSNIEFLWPSNQYFECWVTLTLSNEADHIIAFPEDMRQIGDTPNWNTPGATFEISIKDKIAIFKKVVEPNVST